MHLISTRFVHGAGVRAVRRSGGLRARNSPARAFRPVCAAGTNINGRVPLRVPARPRAVPARPVSRGAGGRWSHPLAPHPRPRPQATPEYKKLNQSMNLEEFKSIYFWEWFHRMWGRSLGVIFVVPLVYFVARKRTRAALSNAGLFPRMATLFLLGGTQGLVGWWMVKSGLEHTHILGFERSEHDMPRVSPYRLATHLSFAFVTYGLLCWTTMDLYSASIRSNVEATIAKSPDVLRRLGRLRSGMVATASIVGLTVVSGAFVAGNLAGLAYNDWPFMAGKFVPAGISEEWDSYNPRVRYVSGGRRGSARARTCVCVLLWWWCPSSFRRLRPNRTLSLLPSLCAATPATSLKTLRWCSSTTGCWRTRRWRRPRQCSSRRVA